jgi:PPOX class probable F420-dependent enzyme
MQDYWMLTEHQTRFLASRRVGHLATADGRGAPHVVPVCFVVSEGALYITIDQKPKGDPRALKRLRNITENPLTAFVADHYDEDWTRLGWVMLRGPAEILADGAEHDRAQALLRSRYPQYQGMALAGLPVIALRIERVTSWGHLSVE